MEQTPIRVRFLNELFEFCKLVKLNQKFWEELNKIPNSILIDAVKKFEKIEEKSAEESKNSDSQYDLAQKVFIFLEFTRERDTCNEIVDVLKKSGQLEASEKLEGFNKSPKNINPGNEISLTVNKTLNWKSNHTYVYKMDANPRGRCIIINNLMDIIVMDSMRFNSIFEQLHFKVDHTDEQGCHNLTAQGIINKLKTVSEDPELSKHDALVVMIISHGRDEKILEYHKEEQSTEAQSLSIPGIVNIFSDKKCKAEKSMPKIFIFNCCREKTKTSNSPKKQTRRNDGLNYSELITVDDDWKANNKHTLICYACAEGQKVWFPSGDITDFGQALSVAIARYACDKSLQEILNMASDKTTAEVSALCMKRQIHLNPGIIKENK